MKIKNTLYLVAFVAITGCGYLQAASVGEWNTLYAQTDALFNTLPKDTSIIADNIKKLRVSAARLGGKTYINRLKKLEDSLAMLQAMNAGNVKQAEKIAKFAGKTKVDPVVNTFVETKDRSKAVTTGLRKKGVSQAQPEYRPTVVQKEPVSSQLQEPEYTPTARPLPAEYYEKLPPRELKSEERNEQRKQVKKSEEATRKEEVAQEEDEEEEEEEEETPVVQPVQKPVVQPAPIITPYVPTPGAKQFELEQKAVLSLMKISSQFSAIQLIFGEFSFTNPPTLTKLQDMEQRALEQEKLFKETRKQLEEQLQQLPAASREKLLSEANFTPEQTEKSLQNLKAQIQKAMDDALQKPQQQLEPPVPAKELPKPSAPPAPISQSEPEKKAAYDEAIARVQGNIPVIQSNINDLTGFGEKIQQANAKELDAINDDIEVYERSTLIANTMEMIDEALAQFPKDQKLNRLRRDIIQYRGTTKDITRELRKAIEIKMQELAAAKQQPAPSEPQLIGINVDQFIEKIRAEVSPILKKLGDCVAVTNEAAKADTPAKIEELKKASAVMAAQKPAATALQEIAGVLRNDPTNQKLITIQRDFETLEQRYRSAVAVMQEAITQKEQDLQQPAPAAPAPSAPPAEGAIAGEPKAGTTTQMRGTIKKVDPGARIIFYPSAQAHDYDWYTLIGKDQNIDKALWQHYVWEAKDGGLKRQGAAYYTTSMPAAGAIGQEITVSFTRITLEQKNEMIHSDQFKEE